MSGSFLDEVIHPISAEDRQVHYAATIKPLSIEGGWCGRCQRFHFVQVERKVVRRNAFSHTARRVAHRAVVTARSVALLFVVGAIVAFAAVVVGASALAAVR